MPPALPVKTTPESPFDHALALALADKPEPALRWAAAIVKAELGSPSGLLLLGRLLGGLGRKDAARTALDVCIARAVDAGLLPLAVAACSDLRKLGNEPGAHLDEIASAFAAGSKRLGEGSIPPPPMHPGELSPLAETVAGSALLDAAAAIAKDAAAALEQAKKGRRAPPRVTRSTLFSALEARGLRKTIEVFEVKTVAKGAKLIVEGEPGAEAYVLARGELEVVREATEDSARIVLAHLHSGAIFGEMALLSRAPRAASVVATTPSIVLVGRKEALDHVAETEPHVGEELAAHCRRRMIQNLERTNTVLGAVSAGERPALVERFVTHTYEKGEKLIAQGDAAEGLHLIASGEVAIVRHEAGGEPFVLATLRQGETVGEVALVLRRPSTADVVAVHPTVSLFLPKASFLALIKEHPLLIAELYAIAIQRDDETASIADQDVLSADLDDFIV